jgi:hypothetical protein
MGRWTEGVKGQRGRKRGREGERERDEIEKRQKQELHHIISHDVI